MKKILLFAVGLLYLTMALPVRSGAQSTDINTYVLFAYNELTFKGGNASAGWGNIVGNIGVNYPGLSSSGYSLNFATSGSAYMADGYQAVAHNVRGDAAGSFYDLYANALNPAFASTIRNSGPIPFTTPIIPTASLPVLPFTPNRALTNGASDLTIAKNAVVTVAPGAFRDVRINDNAVVTFGPGTYNMRNLMPGKNVTIIVDNATIFQIDRMFNPNDGLIFGSPTTAGAKIYVGAYGLNSNTTRATNFSQGAAIYADYFAPTGWLDLGGGGTLTGHFWALRISGDPNNNVYITQLECNTTVNSPVICADETATITAFVSPPGSYTYTWTVPAGVPDPGNVASFSATVAGVYSVVVTDGSSYTCSGSGTLTVKTCDQPVCYECAKAPLVKVDENVTVNFNTNPPTYTGDPDLQPYFTYDNTGATPDLWYASFDLGDKELLITNGATITVTKVGAGNNQYAPGIRIFGTCKIRIDYPSAIVVESLNKQAGDIFIVFEGDITIDGEVRNEVKGTNGMPGAITIQSECAQIYIGPNGRVLDLGVDWGGNLISLLTCGDNPPGNIIVDKGLVKAFAHAHADNLDATRPRIKVVSSGGVTINANTNEPIYDEYANSGTLFDIYPGLLSWVRDNAKPGMVWVQAEKDITVRGHGTDPTTPVRRSFGAIAAITSKSDAPGGLVDVRSMGGNIYGFDRSFDVSGRNRLLLGNFARINLFALEDIELSNTGNPTGNPVVDASGWVIGDKGGINNLVAYNGGVTVGANAVVSAAVPLGTGTIQGQNLVTVCAFLLNNGTIVPAPVLATDCLSSPVALFDCNGALKRSEVLLPGSMQKPATTGEMLVYPNPAAESFILQVSNDSEQAAILSIQDVTGKVVHQSGLQLQQGAGSHTISVSGLTDGVYVVKLQSGTTVWQMKLVVRR